MSSLHRDLSGWGRHPVQTCELFRPERYGDLHPYGDSCIARGQGRSYGDAALNASGAVVLTERLDRLLELDPARGVLRAEAGATLDEILQAVVPHGWFPPVVPGTRFVSLGGCVAADVHGKNQHRAGSFGHHVLSLELILADGSRLRCSRDDNPEVFFATIGGMGLTGIIGEVVLQLIAVETAQLIVEYRRTTDLGHTFEVFEDPDWDDDYTVAWIDCLAGGASGRGVISRAHHAKALELAPADTPLQWETSAPRDVPCDMPGWLLNRHSMGFYNNRYYRRHARLERVHEEHCRDHFFPLDGIGHWNRLYGRRGFIQYQCLLPPDSAREGLASLLAQLRHDGIPVFLAVLKRFAGEGAGLLSFPSPGYTLALDLPADARGLFDALDRLDQNVTQQGGRVYLAKDARLGPETFRAMYPRYGEWLQVKREVDPNNRIQSSLSRRLRIGEPA